MVSKIGNGPDHRAESVCPLLQLVITDDFKDCRAGYEAPLGRLANYATSCIQSKLHI